jgi:oligopeptidase A
MVLSLPTPAYGKPSLLNLAEVHELLRNVGNMLLHMLSTDPWAELSGKTGVEWDAMEVASNFMTHW